MSRFKNPRAQRRYVIGKRIKKNKRTMIYQLDRYQCVYCGLDMTAMPHLLTLDHLMPLSMIINHPMRVLNHPSNLVTACHPCNNVNGNQPPSARIMQYGRFTNGDQP